MKDLYSENYETLMKEIEGDRKKWKDIHGLEELTLLKCLYSPKQFTGSEQSSSTYQWHFSQN